MAEYIEREASIEYLQGYQEHLITLYESMENGVSKQCCLAEICGVSEGIRQMQRSPTADVVEVVRCKDCKHWGGVTFGYICRRFSGTTLRNETRENDYCSFSAKMDGKGEGEC